MAAFYPDHIIDQVRQSSDIIDVLSQFLSLKKRGRNYICLCPFHHEKTPSFSVSQDKQIYHCFGCGKGGNVMTFLMEHEQMSFPEAVKFLAKRAGIPLPEPKRDPKEMERFSRLYYANEQAAGFYHKSLYESDDGRKVLDYIREKRGMTDATIQEFQLGFAPEGWENLIAYAREKKITTQELYDAGLLVKRESGDGFYDRFRQRLMFPIFDLSRRVIGFGARALAAKDNVKYLNSPDSPLYNKSRVLYGLSHSRADIRDSREALVVEGYMDYLSLYQADIRTAVAVSGTSFTRDHALLLKRYADSVSLLFDSDAAGQSAAERCAEHFFAVGIDVRVVALPEGDDPDSFVREAGATELKRVISEAASYFRFVRESAHPPFAERNRAGQQMLLKSQLRLVSMAPDEIARALMLKELSELYDISVDLLTKGVSPEATKPEKPFQPRYTAIANRPELERNVLRLILTHPSLFQDSSNGLQEKLFSSPQHREIFNIATRLHAENREADFASVVDSATDEHTRSTLTGLLAVEAESGDWELAFQEYMQKLKQAYRDDRIRQLTAQLHEARSTGDTDESDALINEINRLRGDN